MKGAPGPDRFTTRSERVCRGCKRTTGMQTSLMVLRAAGWRIYDGPTLGGKTISDTVCPWCAGTTDQPMPGWRIGCNTCGWEWDPDDMSEAGPVTSESDADEIARDHTCEPWTWTKAPPMPAAPSSPPCVTESLLELVS